MPVTDLINLLAVKNTKLMGHSLKLVDKKRLARVMLDDLENFFSSVKTFSFWKVVIAMFIGISIQCIGFNGLLVPNKFFGGGTAGIAMMIFYLLDGSTLGMIYLLINIPVFIFGWREFSFKYLVLSLIGVFMLSGILNLTADIRIPADGKMVSAIFAGLITGMGGGLYLRYGGSTGGLDIIGTILKKRFAIPIGTTFNLVNGATLIGAGFLFDLNTALYTGIYLFVHAAVIEKVQTGFSQRRAVFIVTSKPEIIASEVMRRLDRGVTFLNGSGGYSHKECKVVYTVINMIELGKMKELLFQIDPKALVVVNNTTEVIGNKFLTWEEQGFNRKTTELSENFDAEFTVDKKIG